MSSSFQLPSIPKVNHLSQMDIPPYIYCDESINYHPLYNNVSCCTVLYARLETKFVFSKHHFTQLLLLFFLAAFTYTPPCINKQLTNSLRQNPFFSQKSSHGYTHVIPKRFTKKCSTLSIVSCLLTALILCTLTDKNNAKLGVGIWACDNCHLNCSIT